jgi:hypothetical protein
MHLNIEELVDIAEGARPESSAPHLVGCEPCLAQLRDLRAMMAAAQDVAVPEPSPLFWDHLSSRVSEAVAAEAEEGAARLKGSRSFGDRLAALFGARAFQACVAIAAALLLAVVVGQRITGPRTLAPVPAAATADLLSDSPVENDASLAMVDGLAAGLDADAANEAGLSHVGSAEHAVTHLNPGELRELRRLLKDELVPAGN